MRYAETGYHLEIDLSRGNIERVETDLRLTELYLGGLGTNAKILWDRVPPEVEPFSPDNLLIFSAGLLCGTPAFCANRTIVSTISPQTRLMAFSMMGGFWAPELKRAGYDKIIIRGKSPHLVYLWINNDKVEIRDARHLQGKGTIETAELICREIKEPEAQVAAIGLAGENRVYHASIQAGKGSCSRLGVGAIMGDKNLKAIAVRGTKDIHIARPAEFMELCNELLKYIDHRLKNPLDKGVPTSQLATLGVQEFADPDEGWHMSMFAAGNARYRRKDFWTKEIAEEWKRIHEERLERLVSCYNCPVKCGGLVSHPEIKRRHMLKCSQHVRYIAAARSDNYNFGFKISCLGDEYGIDGFSAPTLMAFAIELYEDGILTDKDMPGFPSNDEDRFFYLLEKIVRREGIGDILANGTYAAARQIGEGAEAYDHNSIKKHEQAPLKLGMMNPFYYLMYCTGEKINITQIEGQFPQNPPETREEREDFIKDWIQVPNERIKEYFLNWEPRSFPYNPPIQACCEIVDWMEMMHYIDDCTGICTLVSSFAMKPPYHIHNFPHIISAATGLDIDEAELVKVTKRTRNLVRAINIRRGMRKADEKPPENHWKHRFPELEAKLLDEYYKFKGWDNQGIPTKEFLHELGMDYVFEDFEMRGIYSDNGNTPSAEISAGEKKEV
ncbi:aldehyde ferredoxin oxidoreductase N-terminal domain-containing protein [Desulfoscipio gibsoniae]|uniref:Aldehyde:ferredoxin oxidoreductase n=1 Tax=Desulfoscipio gibsoniae DSM 7213 TaxID=767817 RepID=R4KEI5_9FIRM|nr:aldehyde ferredoxin oxidoreductase N-terminal domain-containing protein [Desulfoscipio gibsoniae]AGL00077.1 aldehyde:ferredoxin oxidoreductase [Desulfoscipio gibsoniae DSM 7213]